MRNSIECEKKFEFEIRNLIRAGIIVLMNEIIRTKYNYFIVYFFVFKLAGTIKEKYPNFSPLYGVHLSLKTWWPRATLSRYTTYAIIHFDAKHSVRDILFIYRNVV